MANFNYFADMNGTTVELVRVDTLGNADFAARWPNVKGLRLGSFDKRVGYSANGTLFPMTRAVERKASPSNHKCDARCLNARGFKCECSCRGKNHGAGSFTCTTVAACNGRYPFHHQQGQEARHHV